MHIKVNDVLKHKKAFDELYKPLEEVTTVEEGLKLKPNPFLVRNYYEKFCSRIYKNLAIKDGDRVLEAGCGRGFDLKNLSSAYPKAEYYGFDISEVMIKIAKKVANDAYLFLALAENIPTKGSTFSKVYSREVIEHVIDPQGFVAELARVTDNGGIIIITTPNADTLLEKFYLKRKHERGKHTVKDEHLTYRDLKKLLDKSNLATEKLIYDGFLYFALSGGWTRFPRLTSILTRIVIPLSGFFEKILFLNKLFCDQMVIVARKQQT